LGWGKSDDLCPEIWIKSTCLRLRTKKEPKRSGQLQREKSIVRGSDKLEIKVLVYTLGNKVGKKWVSGARPERESEKKKKPGWWLVEKCRYVG